MAEESSSTTAPAGVGRRSFFKLLSLGAPAFVRGVGHDAAAEPQNPDVVTPAAIAAAEQLAGLEFTDAERAFMIDGVAENLQRYQRLPEQGRQRMDRSYENWRQLDPGERARVQQNYQKYRQMTPDQRRDFENKYKRWKGGKGK